METNCNQMSAMQRNARMQGNVNCNCSMNSNSAMGNRGCNTGFQREDARGGRSGGNHNAASAAGRNTAGNCGYGNVRDGAGRSMEVECVCKVNPGQSCYKDDPMDKLGSRFPTVMAYVPWQQWGELYDADCGLMQGTMFKELNLIFCGVRC
ncbi:MAG: spore coat associated protein CotJA [Clostridium sp.]|nr:spore coat associated protein CotJA [Clostridium sp.]